MKKYRPVNAGYILLYVLVAISVVDAAYTLYAQLTNTLNPIMGSFSFFSYLVCAMGLCYAWMYVRAQVCLDDAHLRIAFPAFIRPADPSKRAMIVYRQGPNDLRFIDKTIDLSTLERYGYVEDLGYARVDQSSADEKSPMFAVHEVCFLTSDGKRYHLNAAIFSKKQRREIFSRLREVTGIAPEGKLSAEL